MQQPDISFCIPELRQNLKPISSISQLKLSLTCSTLE